MNILAQARNFQRFGTLILNSHKHSFTRSPLLLNLQRRTLHPFSTDKNNPEHNHQNNPMSRDDRFQKKTEELMKEAPEDEEEKSSYSSSDNKMGYYVMGGSIVALMMAYGWMEVQGMRVQQRLDKSITGMTKVSSSGKAHIGGEWKLKDTKGREFGSEDLQGTYYLIYFGFTNCPDICPNSLIKLSRALEKIRKMPEGTYVNLKTVFVSVDPERDSPEKIEKFLSYFDSSIIGVTAAKNDSEELRECMKKFKIYASKIEFEDEDSVVKGRKSYTIDHTILTYLMSDSNEYLAHLGGNLGEHELAKIIVDKILGNEQEKMRLMRAT